jgi:hypothetical protein
MKLDTTDKTTRPDSKLFEGCLVFWKYEEMVYLRVYNKEAETGIISFKNLDKPYLEVPLVELSIIWTQ